jgi:hypothetical protein
MPTLSLVCGYIICVLIGLLGLLVIWRIFDGSIDLSELISEQNGGASMSRFQFLVFTFVIAFSLFLVIISSGTNGHAMAFPDIPGTVLSLLGISGSSYLVSKGIQFSDPAGIVDRGNEIVISPIKVNVKSGGTQQFTALVGAKPGASVKWEVIAGYGTIDANGLYKADLTTGMAVPAGSPPAATPKPPVHATIQVTSDEFPNAFDLAVVTIVA